MEIKKTIITSAGLKFEIIYNDVDNDSAFEGKKMESVRAYCFMNDRLLIVRESEGNWGIPGGGLEKGESVREGAVREVIEETNMRITNMRLVGMHETIRPTGESVFHARVVCLVEPDGDFVEDPGGEVTEIKFIEPSEFIPMCDAHWGKQADRKLERALEFKEQMKLEADSTK
jgi:ADP-ribose pyrophosphatase YjhB (NUDIX family)